MGLGDALRQLGLLRTRQMSATTHRNSFILGLIGTLVVLAGLILTGWWVAVGAVGGFVGVMISGGVRWYRAAQPPRHPKG